MPKICPKCGTKITKISEKKGDKKYYCPHCQDTVFEADARNDHDEKTSGLIPGSITIHWGKSGGIYYSSGYFKKLCLGRLAITYVPEDFDEVVKKMINRLVVPAKKEGINEIISELEKAKKRIDEEDIDENKFFTLQLKTPEELKKTKYKKKKGSEN